jgi:SecD/SecF fusion protein
MRNRPWLLFVYAGVILFGLITALPNVLTPQQLAALPSWLPNQQVTLGLDLRGGSNLVLEVDAAALQRERVQTLNGDAVRVLRQARIQPQSVRRDNNVVTITLREAASREQAMTLLRGLATPIGPFGIGAPDITVTAVSDTVITVTPTEASMLERAEAAIEQSLEIIRRRIDEIGVAEPTIQRVGADRIAVQLPGVQDPSRIRAAIGSTAKLTFHMLGTGTTARPGIDILPGNDGVTYPIEERIAVSGDRLTDARAAFDPITNQPVISFRFDNLGARQFADITRANVGKPFAIVLDGKVLSAPVIREPIIGGSGQISGGFTVQQTSDLAALLRAGALPAPLTVIEERTVGADLGADAIEMGIMTGLIGFGLVILFMLVLYGPWGLLANLALGLNVALTFGALSLLGATLTLPGIAGIVLGIGLAVDANVLINERIREETRKGARAIVALDAGFNRAYSTIVDSNLTALIATLLLFGFGSGPVRGFAVTMALGIGISMFTAVSIVRVLMEAIVRRFKFKVLRIEPLFGMKLIPEGTKFKFMNARHAGIAFSAVLSIASLALFVYPGLNYGVDFRGGIQMEVVTQGPADLARMRASLEGLDLGEIALQEYGEASRVLVRAERQPGGEDAQNAAVAKIRDAVSALNMGAAIERTEVVGPKVSGELAYAGVLSVVLASIAMLFYIWFRFEWPFAVGAIATLILDVTKCVGFFALTGLDFNLTAIAALLTLIGYSVNDKVVVYDRMRENMRLYKAMPFREMIDKSINETLARSLYTSITAFLALIPMAVWGGSAVESFAVPMVFGIVIAASSSVFIAAPILLFLGDWRKRRRAAMPQDPAELAHAARP